MQEAWREKKRLRATIYNCVGWVSAIAISGTLFVTGITSTDYKHALIWFGLAALSLGPSFILWHWAIELKLDAKYGAED